MASTSFSQRIGRLRAVLDPRRHRLVRGLVTQADAHRDARRFADALPLYEEAVRLAPWRSDLRIQAGHMAKEARRFDIAERHYTRAEAERPDDADLQLQLGHFYRATDRLDKADAHYRAALARSPALEDAVRAVAQHDRRRGRGEPIIVPGDAAALAPELMPSPVVPPRTGDLDEIVFRKLGNGRVDSSVGELPVLAGIEALRGVCFVERPIVEAIVSIDEAVVHRGAVRNFSVPGAAITKAVSNLWIDCTALAIGPHRLELALVDDRGRSRSRFEPIYVTTALQEQDHPGSDAIVTLAFDEAADPEAAIRSRASVVHRGDQPALPIPRSILVLRTDQLGDMVVSLPALRRLRGLFPDAHIVALVTDANAELARTYGIFDEVIAIDFPDDPVQRKRVMSAAAQRELAARLSAYRFDLAIDLATSHVSRGLLKLAGARFSLGFDDASFPWLDGGISGRIRAPHEDSEAAPHAGRILALIERLALLTSASAPVLRRPELARAGLRDLGLDPDRPYIVVHTGARIRFSRWPHYRALAEALHADAGMPVVVLGDADILDAWKPVGAGVRLIAGRQPFDELDTLLSHAALFIGNDSGPKHLAALRGVPVLSLHSARIHWREWGQQSGLIMSRRVPCAGCAIFHDEDECGKDHACITDIRVEEVVSAALSLLRTPAAAP